MNERLDLKAIKEDPFVDAVEQGLEWVRLNTRLLITAAITLATVGVLAVAISAILSSRRESSVSALGAALRVWSAPISAGDPKPTSRLNPTFADEGARRQRAKELFQNVRDEHSGESAAIAEIYLAQLAATDGNLAGARTHWQAFLDDHDEHFLAAGVELSLVRLDRAEGQGESAVERLQTSLDRVGAALPDDVVLWELGQTLEELDRREEAQEAYQQLVDEHPDSGYAGRAREKLAALDAA